MNFLKRVARSIFTWKMAGRLLFAVACLVTLVALVVVEENWRGKREWEAFVREHAARGDRVDMEPLIPPQVPDEQNFAMTPLLKPLYPDENWNYNAELNKKLKFPLAGGKKAPSMGDHHQGKHINLGEWETFLGGNVSDWLKKVEPELAEISVAARRPYARFPLAYEKGFAMPLPHLTLLMQLSKLYALRAEVELQAGRTDAAQADVQTLFRLGELEKNDPFLISQLIWFSIWQSGLQVVWEGLEDHRWTDAQLRILQDELADADFLKGLALAFRGERAVLNETLLSAASKPGVLATMMRMNEDEGESNLWRFMPSGWIYLNLVEANRFFEKYNFAAMDAVAHRVYPWVMKEADETLIKDKAGWSFFGVSLPFPSKMLEGIVMPPLSGITARAAYVQDTNGHAVIACALERYRLANGQFPDTLAKIVPAYLKEVPPDVVNGEAPHYHLNADGTFLLYSDGWDGKDNGGSWF